MSTENPLVAQCPQCQSRFRLTPQHLEAAKGWVQCGMCGHVFFSGLGSAAPTPPSPAASSPPKSTESQPAKTASAPEPAAEPAAGPSGSVDQETSAAEPSQPEASPRVLSGLANRMTEGPVSMTFGPKLESIILMDPNAGPEDLDPGPLPVIGPRPEPGKATDAGSAYQPPSAKAASATGSNWIPRQPAQRAVQGAQKKGQFRLVWGVLTVVLLVAIVTQLAWFLRDTLAARHPGLRPALTHMCLFLDCTLGLPQDPKLVVILGSDLQTENDGRLVLTITMANKAKTSMAWPVLELTLTDVEDQPVARRVFAPSEYLASSRLEEDGIPQLSEVPIALTLQSKDVRAAGYRLRMFY